MKRTISSVLALAMVAALLTIFAGAANAQVTEPSGQIAAINGASTDPVTASANGTQIGGDLAYAADAASAIFPASGSPYTVAFGDGSQTTVTLVGMDAATVVSGFGENGETAKAYAVDVTPIDAGMAKVTVWNATTAPVQVSVDGAAPAEVAPGAGLPTQVVAADAGVTVDIDGVSKSVATPADSYTDVFATNDGTTPAVAQAIISSMTDLIASLTPAPGGVTVPDVVGQTEADANAAITAVGLVAAKTEASSDTVAAGSVVSQDPAGGTEVADGSTVNIVVSTGPEPPTTVPVPDVSGKPAADAQAELEAAGFTVTSEEQDSETVEAGLVIETNPSAGTEVAAGTEVKMIVSTGFGDVVVPDVTGMTINQATEAAEEAGLTITFVEDADDPDPDGLVVSQDPAAGSTVAAGSEVVAQLSPAVDDAWVILTLSPERVLTASGINFQPGSTVDLSVVNTDKDAKATVQGDGSWAASADLSGVQNEAELLLVTGTAADGSAYEATFKIPAAGETTDVPTDEVEVEIEEESSSTPVWLWIVLGLLVVGAIALGIKIFGGDDTTGGDAAAGGAAAAGSDASDSGDSSGADDTPPSDDPTTEAS